MSELEAVYERSLGTLGRGKNQIETPSEANSPAKTPPPPRRGGRLAPFEVSRGSRNVQPELKLAFVSQLPSVLEGRTIPE